MPTPKTARASTNTTPEHPPRRPTGKVIAICAVLVIFAMFWDVLLPLLGEGLHVLVEFVEVMLERLLEFLFNWTPRQAQTLLAWSAVFLVGYGIMRLIQFIHNFCQHAYVVVCDYLDAAKLAWSKVTRLQLIVAAAALIGALYFFI
jgi:hypothetical protein